MCPHIHIGLGKEVRRAEKKAIWAFKDFDNDAYIENFLVNIIYLGMLSLHNISRHFIGCVNE